MKVRQIDITNYKPIHNSGSLLCGNRLNIFIGPNGVGKTTLLDAICILLSWLDARIRNPKGNGRVLKDSDITKGEMYSLLKIIAQENGEDVPWQLYKQSVKYREEPVDRTMLKEVSAIADEVVRQNISPTLFAYYGVNRAVIDIPQRKGRKQMYKEERAIGEQGNLMEKDTHFRTFFEWFRAREDLENELYRRDREHWQEDKQLKTVRKAFRSVFSDYSELKVQRHPLAFVIEKKGKKIDFQQLSDGEKCYISLIGDIAQRLSRNNPNMEDPLQGAGIILIDEIDLHLHPSWQREIIKKLCITFPNCQFFITTHSPYVLTSVNNLIEAGRVVSKDSKLKEQVSNIIGGNLFLNDVDVKAYSIIDGKVKDILNQEEGLIMADDIDDTSDKTEEEYIKLLEL